ncbi:MAG: hypothetical protein B7X97_02960 [Methylotenera sp. 17-45-7]|jgi:GR25 family glycosyltransferase involved in LPS biosynthesis|nr:MAG: hypothetical protein B7X97_02960 [Methylotenera sp. 17-45-7]
MSNTSNSLNKNKIRAVMKIRYINLERSPDRRAHIERLLDEQGVAEISERFAGIVAAKPFKGLALSVTGCLMSHLALINTLQQSETIVILEDDACFSKNFSNIIPNIPSLIDEANLDVIFLGQTVAFNDSALHAQLIKFMGELRASDKYRILNADTFYRYGTFGYVINKKSVSKIKKLIAALDLTRDAKPIDSLMSQWIKTKKLSAGVMFPNLVGVESSFETMMYDRSHSLNHRLHCELVNIYLNDRAEDVVTEWHNILGANPNPDALAICKIMYARLTQ